MSTIISDVYDNQFGYDKRLLMKGAAEIVLASCSHYINKDNERKVLDSDTKAEILKFFESYAADALRIIGVAYKDLVPDQGGEEHDHVQEGSKDAEVEKEEMTWIGMLGIRDIIREEVPGAIAKCESAGVKVRMVTGDALGTAIAIGHECNLIKNEDRFSCMLGKDFSELVGGLRCLNCEQKVPCDCPPKLQRDGIVNRQIFAQIREQLCILARCRPEDKYLLACGLRQFGDVVACTGDGTNDGPALKKSDVGFAMGITGTDVAKDASDIIILDDNFASIVKAMVWGRNIYDSIRKFLQF